MRVEIVADDEENVFSALCFCLAGGWLSIGKVLWWRCVVAFAFLPAKRVAFDNHVFARVTMGRWPGEGLWGDPLKFRQRRGAYLTKPAFLSVA